MTDDGCVLLVQVGAKGPGEHDSVSDGFSTEQRRCLSWMHSADTSPAADGGAAGGGGAGGPGGGAGGPPSECHLDAITAMEVVCAAGAPPLLLRCV